MGCDSHETVFHNVQLSKLPVLFEKFFVSLVDLLLFESEISLKFFFKSDVLKHQYQMFSVVITEFFDSKISNKNMFIDFFDQDVTIHRFGFKHLFGEVEDFVLFFFCEKSINWKFLGLGLKIHLKQG